MEIRFKPRHSKNSLLSDTLARIVGAIRYAFTGRNRRASVSTAVVELMTLDSAREQYANQLRRLDGHALLKEIKQLRRVVADLASRDKSA